MTSAEPVEVTATRIIRSISIDPVFPIKESATAAGTRPVFQKYSNCFVISYRSKYKVPSKAHVPCSITCSVDDARPNKLTASTAGILFFFWTGTVRGIRRGTPHHFKR